MMDSLRALMESVHLPFLSALLLGLMTAVSPCPLATNITATAYISRNITDKRKVFFSGLVYMLGRAISYTGIGLALYFGASKFHVARFFNQNGEKVLGPLLILIGLVMLDVIKLTRAGGSGMQERLSERFKDKGLLGALVIGILFALAFCPYSGAMYFGMLIPMTISSAHGLYLPVVFALGTALPVIIFTYLLAFAAGKVGLFYKRVVQIERLTRKIAGIVFILAGLYYIAIFAGGLF